MPETNNNKNLTNASKVRANNEAVNNLITENLNRFCEIENTEEMMHIMERPFKLSSMCKGSAMGGSYQLEVNTLYPGKEYNNKAYIFDAFTLKNLSDTAKEHLYVDNGIYASCKSRLLEKAGQYAKENHYDNCKFSDTDQNYTMRSAEFDFFYQGKKIATQTLTIETKSVMRHVKEDLRGFTGYNVDIDNVDAVRAQNLINDINSGIVPMPTIIVVTGTGLHLWYICTSPIASTSGSVLQKYQTMMGLFTRKFTHNPRYCGKEEETGSFQHDLPIGQSMRAVGNIYDKYENCPILMRGYTSGIYHDFKALNEWADIPEIEVSRKSSTIKYDSKKARRLSPDEYRKLFDSFLTESVGSRTRHRNLLFHHMLVEGNIPFDNALETINRMVEELNRLYPVEGNAVRLLTVGEARRFDPNSPDFDHNYYSKYLSTGAMVDSQIYKNHIKQPKYRTGLNKSENMKKVNKEVVCNIGLRAECLLYALVNTLNNDRENKSGVAEYHGQQCIIGNYDFTPFVMPHPTTYNLGKDGKQRTVKNSYKIIDNPDTERHQVVLARVFAYLNGVSTQRVGSTDIYSNRQELIHHLLLASTSQETRDEFYNRYSDVAVPRRYGMKHEALFREINNYSNILLSLVHHHFNKIKEGVQAEHAYITGNTLTMNRNKCEEALARIKRLLALLNARREVVVRKGVDTELINAINATNQQSVKLAMTRGTMEHELAENRLYETLLHFSGRMSMQARFDEYENILNLINTSGVELSFDGVFKLWLGNSAFNRQAKKEELAFITELNNRWDRLQALLPVIQKTDSQIRRLINKGKGDKSRLRGTFMYTCFLRHHLGFLDMLPPDIGFPFATAYKYAGMELTKIGQQLLQYNNDMDKVAELTYPTYNPQTGERGYARGQFTDRGYMMGLARYYRLSGRYRSDETVIYLAKQLAIFLCKNDYRFKDNNDIEIRTELIDYLKEDTMRYLNALNSGYLEAHNEEENNNVVIFEDSHDEESDDNIITTDGNIEEIDEDTINAILGEAEEDVYDMISEKDLWS